MSKESPIQAVRWKLGLDYSYDTPESAWKAFKKGPNFDIKLTGVAKELASPLRYSMYQHLNVKHIPLSEKPEIWADMSTEFCEFLSNYPIFLEQLKSSVEKQIYSKNIRCTLEKMGILQSNLSESELNATFSIQSEFMRERAVSLVVAILENALLNALNDEKLAGNNLVDFYRNWVQAERSRITYVAGKIKAGLNVTSANKRPAIQGKASFSKSATNSKPSTSMQPPYETTSCQDLATDHSPFPAAIPGPSPVRTTSQVHGPRLEQSPTTSPLPTSGHISGSHTPLPAPRSPEPLVEHQENLPADVEPAVIGAEWKNLDVNDTLDRHDSLFALRETHGDLVLLGARARGKKHKHEGTNCDDWFEFQQVENWAIIAVSDGAGSKRFSRIGAKASCRAAVKVLAERLKNFKVERTQWDQNTFARDSVVGNYTDPELGRLEGGLHDAMQVAHQAIMDEFQKRELDPRYAEALGRPLAFTDFSCTLLLTVHTMVTSGHERRSFGMSCQIGDGMSALIIKGGRLQLLGIPDSGAYSGETDFITSKAPLAPERLRHKTIPFLAPMQALLVMTDGVADDYFPNDPEMLRLYGDLVLNGAIRIEEPASTGTEEQGFHRVSSNPTLLSVAEFANSRRLSVQEVVSSPLELKRGIIDRNRALASTPEAILCTWLDTYHVRGSFDDRTLVALYPKVLS